ncbi:GIN domain-containing protein [Pedobacter sp. UBA5917]|jgi:hypothetical protein|uniref:GIN domain-containing protein n=1 Tax=Pedobacter sp. UBA5917 TaxID=1947061 RepID=UPI0025CB94FC|nr:DUF2807 domain-containing protein [Pedobacter sp. UBA5917]
MKFSIKTQIATAFASILLVTAAVSTPAHATEEKPIKTTKVLPFRKISITGNIEVTLIQRVNPGINYDDNNEGDAKVIQQGESLKITGTSKIPGKLIIYVSDLYRIEADENVVVKTEGILSTKYLQIVLKGNASADIYSTSDELYTSIQDKSALYLRGNTKTHFLFMDKTPKLTFDQFAALHTQATDF